MISEGEGEDLRGEGGYFRGGGGRFQEGREISLNSLLFENIACDGSFEHFVFVIVFVFVFVFVCVFVIVFDISR